MKSKRFSKSGTKRALFGSIVIILVGIALGVGFAGCSAEAPGVKVYNKFAGAVQAEKFDVCWNMLHDSSKQKLQNDPERMRALLKEPEVAVAFGKNAKVLNLRFESNNKQTSGQIFLLDDQGRTNRRVGNWVCYKENGNWLVGWEFRTTLPSELAENERKDAPEENPSEEGSGG